MPQPADQYEPALDDEAAVPVAWRASLATPTAIVAECACPLDCPRDHDND